MTTRKYSSRSQQTTLTGALTSSGTTATVVSGTALLGGVTISAGEIFTVVIDPDTALEEIVDVSAVSTNTLTIVRGIDGSTGQAHSAGAVVRHMAIGRDYREANTHIEATTGHGATGAVVGTTNTQTLTNKTLTSPVITTPTISSLTLGDGNIVFEGATADAFETTLTVAEPTADRTVTIPDATTTLVGTDTTQTLTNKTLTSPTITGTGAIAGTFTGNLTGNVTGSSGSTTGNAATATALATGRTFQLTGDVEASGVTFDGTGNVSLTTVIGTGAIVNADINASAAIDKTKISGTAVTVADTGTVTSTMIANDTIVNADISGSAGIAYTKLSLNGTITSADIVDGTIVAGDIANGTITAAKMVSDPYARANHTGTQLASTVSDFDTQVRTSKVTDLAAPTGSFSMNSQKITSLATPTVGTDASTKDYVDAQITALVGGAPGTLDTLKEIADAISSGGSFESTVVLKSGSTMTGALVLNADPSVNLGAATKQYVDAVAGSATAAASSATAAAASYDSFDDRYLGSKSSAPSVDNDGNALITGALYWNSVDNTMYVWSGTAWGSISSTAAIFRYRFAPATGATSVTGTDANGATLSYLAGKEQVYLNGVLLVRDSDYTATNGTSITSLAAMVTGDVLEVITFTAFSVITSAMTDVQNTFVTDQIINGVKVGEGSGSLSSNTVFGSSALNANTTGANNTAIGRQALRDNTIGDANTAIGQNSMLVNTTGAANTAVGRSTLSANTTGLQNVAVGAYTMSANTIGSFNTAVGDTTLFSNTTGNYNTAVGKSAMQSNTTGVNNTAFGVSALSANTTGTTNVALGISALQNNTIGYDNTSVGGYALYTNTTGVNNTAVGRAALYASTTAYENVAVGSFSLYANTTGVGNTAVGHNSMLTNTTGSSNVAFGSNALRSNTTGYDNTAIGLNAMYYMIKGVSNVAVGIGALQGANGIGTGDYNTAVGRDTLLVNQGGSNVAIGNSALRNNTTGTNNVAVGQNAIQSQTIGTSNVAVGDAAGYALTTGSNNTFIGNNAGNSGTNNATTGSNNTIIGYIAALSSATVSNTVTLGNSSIATLRCQVTSITALSDERDKKNIQPLAVGLEFIKSLNPVTFDWNMRDGGKVDVPDVGFIAQELMAAEDAIEMADQLQLTYRDNPDQLEATQGRLIPILVKAIQDLAAEVETLRNQINA